MTNYLPNYQTIQSALNGRVLTLTLNRPDKLNAVDAVMHRELSTIFADINLDPDVDVVVLTGAGRAFSTGGDTKWMNDLIAVEGEWQRKAVESRRIWLSLLDLEKPLICKLNGLARGMCTTIVSLCDVVIASDRADIADTHMNMALAAADGCNAIWPFKMGFAKTKDLLFNATALSAQEAKELGLVQYVVAHDELDRFVDDFVAGLMQRSIRGLQVDQDGGQCADEADRLAGTRKRSQSARDVELPRRPHRSCGRVQRKAEAAIQDARQVKQEQGLRTGAALL